MSLAGFATGDSKIRSFNAVIHGVAHQMHQWITDLFNNGFIQFGFGAADD